jgi:hypothetical protein
VSPNEETMNADLSILEQTFRASIEYDGSSRSGFENGSSGVVDGPHADIILLRRVIVDRRWKQGGTDRILVEYHRS